MSQETLKTLRFLVPGVLLALVLEPLLSTPDWLTELGLPDTQLIARLVGYPVQVILLGAIYHVLDLRRLAFRKPVERVRENIGDCLLQCCEGYFDLLAHEKYLRSGRRLMHIFYRIVDDNATLKEKAKRVRFNGALWSTCADIQVIGVLGSLIYGIVAATSRSLNLFVTALVLLGTAILFRGVMELVTREHLDLSNEQLEVITQYYCQDVRDQVSQLVGHADE